MKTTPMEKQVDAPKKWTVDEKLRVIAAFERLEGLALVEFLLREGLNEAQVKSWADAAAGALKSAEATMPMTAKQRRRLAVAEKRVALPRFRLNICPVSHTPKVSRKSGQAHLQVRTHQRKDASSSSGIYERVDTSLKSIELEA